MSLAITLDDQPDIIRAIRNVVNFYGWYEVPREILIDDSEQTLKLEYTLIYKIDSIIIIKKGFPA